MATQQSVVPQLVAPSMFDDFEFDVLQEFKADYDAEVTDNPVETGFVVADHVIKKPVKLNLTVLFTPTNVTWNDRRGGTVSSRLYDVEKTIKLKRDAGLPGIVVTQNNIYENYVMTSCSFTRDEKGYKLTANMEFTEVILVSVETADVPEAYADAAAAAAAGDTDTDAGTATTADVTASTNNSDTATTGSEETAETSNKSIAASMADYLTS